MVEAAKLWVTLTPAIIGLVGVVIGAGISTGIAYLLAVRKEASDTRNWRRDHALEAYTDVLKTCATIRSEAAAAYIAECDTEEHTKHAHLIYEAVTELHSIVDRVLILSPKEMYDDVRTLVSYFSREFGAKLINCPKVSSTEWDEIQGAQYSEVFRDFIAAARNDLGIHAPHLTAEELMRFNQQGRGETAK